MSRSLRIQVVRVVRESIGPGGKIKATASYEKHSVIRVGAAETVYVDGEARPLTKYGVRVPLKVAAGCEDDAVAKAS